jgi:uncharacterized C2H2 Zn-finger protein
MRNHQEKSLVCPKCPRVFRWDSSLKSHLSAAHSDEYRSEISASEFCGKVFKDKSNLRKHRYEHIGAPYNCKSCGHGFGRKDFLENHEAKCNMISKRTSIPFH